MSNAPADYRGHKEKPVAVVSLLFLALLMLVSCGRNKVAEFAEGDFAEPPASLESTVPFPLFISYQELQSKIDNSLPQPLFEDSSMSGGQLENLKAYIEKTGPVRISSVGERLIIEVPIRMDLKVLVEKKILGVNFKAKPDFSASLNVTVSTTVEVDSSYSILTAFKLEKIEWVEKPAIRILLLNIPVTDAVELKLKESEPMLVSALNRTVYKVINLDKPIARIWEGMQKPIVINRSYRKAWMLVHPKALYLNDIVLGEDQLQLNLALKADLSTEVSSVLPQTDSLAALPPLQSGQEGDMDLNLRAVLPLEVVNELLYTQIVGQEFLVGETTLKFQSVKLSTRPGLLHVDVELLSPTEGEFNLFGKFSFLKEDTSLVVRDFDFGITESHSLFSAANALLHDQVKAIVEEKVVIRLDPLLSQLPEIISKAVNEGRIGEKINLQIKDLVIIPVNIYYMPESLQIDVNAKGEVSVNLVSI